MPLIRQTFQIKLTHPEDWSMFLQNLNTEGARHHNEDTNLYSNENLIFLSTFFGVYLQDVNKKRKLNTDCPLSVSLSVCRSLESIFGVSINL
jgi:hypothetical protein